LRRTFLTTALLLGTAATAQAQSTMTYIGAPATARYTSSDTTTRAMGGVSGVGSMVHLATTIELSIRAEGDSLRVTSKLTDLKGGVSAMGQEMELPKQPGWDAPAEFMIAANGGARMTQMPTGPAASSDAFTRMFPKLPTTSLQRGGSWTDTSADSLSDGDITGVTNVRTTATWERDTTVDGRAVRVLRYVAEHDVNVTGRQNGGEIRQQLRGTVTTIALYDPARKLMVEVHENGELRGTIDAPSMGISGAELVQTVARHTKLQ